MSRIVNPETGRVVHENATVVDRPSYASLLASAQQALAAGNDDLAFDLDAEAFDLECELRRDRQGDPMTLPERLRSFTTAQWPGLSADQQQRVYDEYLAHLSSGCGNAHTAEAMERFSASA